MDRIRINEFECVARAEFYALRITVAQVALKYLFKRRMVRDVAKRACVLAHLASYALAVVDDNSIVVVACDGLYRAYLHAGRLLALQTHHRNGYSCFLILKHMNIGILRVEFSVVAK